MSKITGLDKYRLFHVFWNAWWHQSPHLKDSEPVLLQNITKQRNHNEIRQNKESTWLIIQEAPRTTCDPSGRTWARRDSKRLLWMCLLHGRISVEVYHSLPLYGLWIWGPDFSWSKGVAEPLPSEERREIEKTLWKTIKASAAVREGVSESCCHAEFRGSFTPNA